MLFRSSLNLKNEYHSPSVSYRDSVRVLHTCIYMMMMCVPAGVYIYERTNERVVLIPVCIYMYMYTCGGMVCVRMWRKCYADGRVSLALPCGQVEDARARVPIAPIVKSHYFVTVAVPPAHVLQHTVTVYRVLITPRFVSVAGTGL